ncbi:MAG: FMN-binding protein [Clostridiales bacterium]|nr:FMN-binding protein [Clostridiales bacterium]
MLKEKISDFRDDLKEKISNLRDSLGEHTRGSRFCHVLTGVAHFCAPVLPAICLGVLVISTLYGYQKPEAAAYQVAATGDIVFGDAAQSSASEDNAEEASTQEQAKGSFDLEDGVYRGTGIGYGGNVVVDVTIASQSITAIDVVDSSGETSSFFSKATAVIDAIIAAQSTDVDVISGATYSSNGIISAVKNALTGEEATGTTATASSTSSGSTSVGTVSESGTYKDGTYTGSAQGFGGTIKVQVTIKDSKIKSISVLSASGETSSYLSKAKAVLTSIVSKQSTNVDTVSGATYSSAGLIKAVRNALSKAKTSSSSSSSSSKKKKKSSSTTTAKKTETSHSAGAATTGGLPYDDGTYYGTGTGWGGTTKVSVTIKDKAITAITIISHEDTESYFNKAKEGLLPQVISQQNTNVDVVSGATYSSEGILEAIDNALAAAEATSKNSGSTTESTTETAAETTTEASSESSTELVYKNGTYSGSAECVDTDYDEFEYTVTVTLTLESDVITDLTVTTTDDGSNSSYISRATNGTSKYTGVKQQIMDNGGTDGVDAVSGATFTSNAIISAAQSALNQAKN